MIRILSGFTRERSLSLYTSPTDLWPFSFVLRVYFCIFLKGVPRIPEGSRTFDVRPAAVTLSGARSLNLIGFKRQALIFYKAQKYYYYYYYYYYSTTTSNAVCANPEHSKKLHTENTRATAD